MSRLSEIEQRIYETAGTEFSILNFGSQVQVLKKLSPNRRTKLEKLIVSYRQELKAAGKRALNDNYCPFVNRKIEQ